MLVESNFERFIRAKATIDNVYNEMRHQDADTSATKSRPIHSRHTSRSSNLFGGGGASTSVNASAKPQPGSEKKYALVKETEYGVQGIKAPMMEAASKAKELWGPALGGIAREEQLRSVVNTVSKYSGVFEAPAKIATSIRARDYHALAEEYARARRYAAEAKELADGVLESHAALADPQIYQLVVTAQMWGEVEAQIEAFKRDVWRRLVATRIVGAGAGPAVLLGGGSSDHSEDHMALISVLLELGVQDNPIWVWLLSQYDYLKRKISAVTTRFRLEAEIVRRRLAAASVDVAAATASPEPRATREVALRLRNALSRRLHGSPPATDDGSRSTSSNSNMLDAPAVLEMWEALYASLQVILSSRGGVVGEVARFWDTAQAFIDGRTQRTLPVGIDGSSRKHHRLSTDGVRDLRNGVLELVSLIREGLFTFFVDPPPDDLAQLSRQLTAASGSLSPVTLPQTAFRNTHFDLRVDTCPPLSAAHHRQGQGQSQTQGQNAGSGPGQIQHAWKKFAFWPPCANSISGVHYLGRMLVLVGAAAGEMAALGPVTQDDAAKERLRGLVSGARERGVQAICAAWNSDAESCKALEDWARAPDQRGVTNMPAYFTAFESEVLTGMQRILYVSDGVGATGAAAARHSDVVSAPRAKLLQLVRSQFVTSLYKSLSGMVENAERGAETDDDEWSVGGPDDLVGIGAGGGSSGMMARDVAGVDASDRNVRMLLTLGNLQALRRDVVPQLVTQFETAFAVKLADESKTMRDVLGQIEARLFHSYIRPFVGSLARTIRAGVLSPGWAPPPGGRPSEVRAYVYDVLTQLVLVHAQVVRATGTGTSSTSTSTSSSSASASASGSSNSSSGGSGPSSSFPSSSATSALLPQILSYLLEQATREFLDAFRRRARFSLAALMQATLDVEFVAQTLAHYTTERAAELQAQIYIELGKATEPDAERRLQAELPEMRNVLRALRDNSRAEFACFRKPRTTAANAATATTATTANNATAAGSSASAPQ